jgi:hypothetical protein
MRYFDGYFEIFELSENSATSRRNTNDVSCRSGWETTSTLKFAVVTELNKCFKEQNS